MEKPLIRRVQEFWDARPCNIRHSRADADVDPERYDEEVARRRYFVEPHILDFARPMQWKGKRVLDLGCGIGTDSIAFAVAGADVTGMDISPRSVEIACKRAATHKLPGLRFVCGDIEELPRYVEPRRFDLVYSFGVLHHTPRPGRVLGHLQDGYMGPDSVLKIMLYNRYSWKVFWILATYGRFRFWRWDELTARHSEAQTGCPLTRTYTPKSVRKLLKGFAVEDMHVDFIFPYRVEDYIRHRYIKEWYWRWMPPAWFRWLEKHFGWHLLITAKLRY